MTTTSFFYSTSEISGKTTITTKIQHFTSKKHTHKNNNKKQQTTTKNEEKKERKKKERVVRQAPKCLLLIYKKIFSTVTKEIIRPWDWKWKKASENLQTPVFFKRLLARIATCGLESHSARAARDTETTDISGPISSPVCFVLPRNRHFLSLCFSFSVTRLSLTTDQGPFVLARNWFLERGWGVGWGGGGANLYFSFLRRIRSCEMNRGSLLPEPQPRRPESKFRNAGKNPNSDFKKLWFAWKKGFARITQSISDESGHSIIMIGYLWCPVL